MDDSNTQDPAAARDRQSGLSRAADVFVGILTLAFAVTALWICRAKWINHDPYFLDFAKSARLYEHVVQGVPIENKSLNYMFIYAGFHSFILSIYVVFRSPALIVFIHVMGFAACILLIYAVAKRRLGYAMAAAAFAAGFALNPAIDMMAIAFKRIEIWCGAALLATVWLMDRKQPRRALAAATLGCFFRIDAIPAFLTLGAVFWLTKRQDEGRSLVRRCVVVLGLQVVGIGIMRLILGGGASLDQMHLSGLDPGGSAISRLAALIFDAGSYAHLRLFAHVALLSLAAPIWILPAVPSFGYMILTTKNLGAMEIVGTLLSPDNILIRQMHSHFSIVIPILFLSAIVGFQRLTRFGLPLDDERAIRRRTRVASALLLLFFVAIHVGFAGGTMGAMPLTPEFEFSDYSDTPHAAVLRDVVANLPVDRFGVLQFSISERAWHLPRTREYYKPEDIDARADYVVFDLFALSANIPKARLLEGIEATLLRDEFEVSRFEDGVIVLERGSRDSRSDDVLEFIRLHRASILF